LPTEAAERLTLFAAFGLGRFFMPAFFLELAENAFLDQLALQDFDGFFYIVVLDRNLHLKSPTFFLD
jgi:hypothetical protein